MCSTLFVGCYSSTLLTPGGDGDDKVDPGSIRAIVTSDSTRFAFDRPPTITNDAVVGEVDGELASIPMSDVAAYYGEDLSTVGVVCVMVGFAALAGAAFYAHMVSAFSVF